MGDSVNIAARLEGIADPIALRKASPISREKTQKHRSASASVRDKTASSGVTRSYIASTLELGGDPDRRISGGRQACRARPES